jgi:hypothetical protein
MRKATLISLFFFAICLFANAANKHIRRTAVNLALNPSLSGSVHWLTEGDAAYDANISRKLGSGSLRLQRPYNVLIGGSIHSDLIPVIPGKTYTFALYSKSNVWPASIAQFYAEFDKNGKFLHNGDGCGVCQSAINSWEESVIFITPGPNTRSIQLKIVRRAGVNDSGYVWLDDFYLGEGVGFEQPPGRKIPFNGSVTRIDSLGNMEICKNDRWVPFFPIAVYGSAKRADWKIYSERGFNCNMWASERSSIFKAKNAVSKFNPDGMYSGMDVTDFLDIRSKSYNNLTELTNRITSIKIAGLMDHLLWYYDDHEDYVGYPKAIADAIKLLDVDSKGNRMHPIYMLQGNYNIARAYEIDGLSDITGTYLDTESPNGITVLNNIEKQINPVVFAQLNLYKADLLSPALWRRSIYDAILSGAKGIGWWMDCTSNCSDFSEWGLVPFEKTGLYPILPAIRREIDALIPVLREPGWTDWSFTSTNSSVKFGTREHNGVGYIIAINTQGSDATTTFSTSDLSFNNGSVINYFTNEKVTDLSNAKFTITIPKDSTAVYSLITNSFKR